jgi:hypothetical protein
LVATGSAHQRSSLTRNVHRRQIVIFVQRQALLWRSCSEIGASRRSHLNKALGLQQLNRLAHRPTTHAEPLGERAFRRQAIASGKTQAQRFPKDGLCDLMSP